MDQRLGQLRQQVNRSISQKQEKLKKGSKIPRLKTALQYLQQLKKDVNTFLALPKPEKSQLDELIRKIDTYHTQIMNLLPFGYSLSKTLNAYIREMEDFLLEMKAFVTANYYMKMTRTQGGQQGKHSTPSDQLGSQSDSSFSSAYSAYSAYSAQSPQSDSSFISAQSGQLSSPRTPRQQPVPLSPHRRTSATRHTTVRKYKNNKHIHDAKQLSFTAVGIMTIVAFALSLGFALSKTK